MTERVAEPMRLDGAWREERRARLRRWALAALVLHAGAAVYVVIQYAFGLPWEQDAGGAAEGRGMRWTVLAAGLLGVWESLHTASRLHRGASTVIEERWLIARNRVLVLVQCALLLELIG